MSDTFIAAIAEIAARHRSQLARLETEYLSREMLRRLELERMVRKFTGGNVVPFRPKFPGALADRETASGVLPSVSAAPGKP